MREIALSIEPLVPSTYPESESSEMYSVSESDTDVVFDVDPAGFGLLADYKPEFPIEGSKTLRVSIPIGDISTLGRVVARYSGSVRVVSPPEARKVVFEYANRALGKKLVEGAVE